MRIEFKEACQLLSDFLKLHIDVFLCLYPAEISDQLQGYFGIDVEVYDAP